jgi:hypothetical protein
MPPAGYSGAPGMEGFRLEELEPEGFGPEGFRPEEFTADMRRAGRWVNSTSSVRRCQFGTSAAPRPERTVSAIRQCSLCEQSAAEAEQSEAELAKQNRAEPEHYRAGTRPNQSFRQAPSRQATPAVPILPAHPRVVALVWQDGRRARPRRARPRRTVPEAGRRERAERMPVAWKLPEGNQPRKAES